MGVLIDTSVLVAAERRGRTDLDLPGPEEPAGISVITLLEYWKGVERASSAARRQQRVAFFESLRARMTVIDLDREIALAAARLWADLERRGEMIPAFDLLIAATALERGWSLATADRRDFARVEGLKLIDLSA